MYTPAGPIPVRGSEWFVRDQWLEHKKIPAWAIVLTIIGFFCLSIMGFFCLSIMGFFSIIGFFCLFPLSMLFLLFLLIKESYYEGTVDITVINGRQQYTTRIPVRNQAQVQHVYQQVNYVRMLATR